MGVIPPPGMLEHSVGYTVATMRAMMTHRVIIRASQGPNAVRHPDAVRHHPPKVLPLRDLQQKKKVASPDLCSCVLALHCVSGRGTIVRRECNTMKPTECRCHREPDGRLCDPCAEYAFKLLQEQVVMEGDQLARERERHQAVCPTPDDCCCSNRKPGTLGTYQARSYIKRSLYCECEEPSFSPIVKTQEGLSGGMCSTCGLSMRPREEGLMPEEPDERYEGPTYDRWVAVDDGYGGTVYVRGAAESPERVRLGDGRLRHTMRRRA